MKLHLVIEILHKSSLLSPDFIRAREEAQKVFDSVDSDGNGVITKGEAAEFLFRTGREQEDLL